MNVQLDDDNRPVAWGDGIDGHDIPRPPMPAADHRWNGGRWVHDPITRDTPAKIKEDLANGNANQRKALNRLLEVLS
jgi:hypothetical protein